MLRIDEGREENSPRSEFGVWLPSDRRGCTWGESSTIICVDVPEDRREFTELERREETDVRPRWLPPLEPNFPFDPLPLLPVLSMGRG